MLYFNTLLFPTFNCLLADKAVLNVIGKGLRRSKIRFLGNQRWTKENTIV